MFCHFSLHPCLFWFEGAAEGCSTERVLRTSVGLKIALAEFLRHRRRILASHTTSSHQPTMTDFTAGTTYMLIQHGTIPSPHTCIRSYADMTLYGE